MSGFVKETSSESLQKKKPNKSICESKRLGLEGSCKKNRARKFAKKKQTRDKRKNLAINTKRGSQ
jgi:hypothetical protein